MLRGNGNNLPDIPACLAIMARFHMPEHVIRHSKTVCSVALYLTRHLTAKGISLDMELIRSASMLHDITKRYSFNRPLDHALTGSKLLRRLGFPEIAEVVRQHVRISDYRPNGPINEAVVVNYADKRVVEDRITLLDDRIEYIKKRYGRDEVSKARIAKNARQVYAMERDIYSVLHEDPADLLDLVPAME